ncbi:anthranilate synthase component 1 [Candidatus Nitrososphaera gargensis Ga9.2]|uniref:Anthranilate synthase component 1 n=1 Tax=Nitrososphaera gargensis (strain Ga9.2) TaxID=1237085 RepID=K0IBR4_NITGG|nr:anthranilate synthase component I [Candidatus Nitrososphaera gargensis]AFU58696.1 anthranilate synthase component 1 [Candidatus Nitrososphaera gargensis Ga9.2]
MVTFGQLAGSSIQIHKLATSENQFELFKKIYSLYDKVFILESLIGPKELAEMSVIGFDPEVTVTCDSKKFTVRDRKGKVVQSSPVTEPLSQLRELMPKVNDERFRYIGGAVGYINYDAIRFWEHLPVKGKKQSNFPLLEFGIYQDGILYNHEENQAYYFFLDKSRLQEVERKMAKVKNKATRFSYSTPRRNMTKQRFIKMVKKAKHYVYEGDVFQVVLAKSMNFTVKGNLIDLYASLREVNPSPYMYLLKISERCIIGSSPEMLIRVTKDYVETFPIAGTRPIVEDEKKNEELRQDLLKDEKEIAEHTMLVDLARNDIGRVCEFGTVRVNELMTVKRFSHVQHIVSHVVGRLQKSYDSYDALKAVFPAGTVSGAPKVRAMEIIDELEPTLRGPYAGALGYFSFNGSCDFAITIRSLFVNGRNGYIESGAGIVMDSDPEREWAETEHKANAMLSALKKASK